MKNILILFLLMPITQGCSQTPVRKSSGLQSVDQFQVHFPTENVRLRGILSLDHLDGDLSKMTYTDYRGYLEEHGVGSKVVLQTLDESAEHLIESTTSEYIVCLKNLEVQMAACDHSSTSHLDQVARGRSLPDLKDLRAKIK
jgi:hypothetical protein